MPVKISFMALLVSLTALLMVFRSATPSAQVQSAPMAASLSSMPAPAGQSGAIYVPDHGNWG
jgi:hypothetical protein